MITTIQISKASSFSDVRGHFLRKQAQAQLGMDTGVVKHTKVFAINYPLTPAELKAFANECIKDAITDDVFINRFWEDDSFQSYIAIAKLPGVTDDEGMSAQMALADFLNKKLDLKTQHIFSQEIFYIKNSLSVNQLLTIAKKLLANPLIHHISVFHRHQAKSSFRNLYVPFVEMKVDQTTHHINLNISDEDLRRLSKKLILALNLEEMQAIQNYFNRADIISQRAAQNLKPNPTDCELEILAQTWSEHCKHKEFSAVVQ
ncbi:MAG TPA: phosphoribosylformylglycinamidine synthase, partial [Phaeodactylibacter sp.]|nr:phosphoribosylformylglycinamidine synthase [Phaeodactylibacter sp.]